MGHRLRRQKPGKKFTGLPVAVWASADEACAAMAPAMALSRKERRAIRGRWRFQNGDFLRLGPTHCAMVVQFIRHDTRGLIDAIVELASRFLYFHCQVGTSQAARWYARRDD